MSDKLPHTPTKPATPPITPAKPTKPATPTISTSVDHTWTNMKGDRLKQCDYIVTYIHSKKDPSSRADIAQYIRSELKKSFPDCSWHVVVMTSGAPSTFAMFCHDETKYEAKCNGNTVYVWGTKCYTAAECVIT